MYNVIYHASLHLLVLNVMHYHTMEYNIEEMKTLLVPDDSYDLANVQIINHIFVQKHILHTDHK